MSEERKQTSKLAKEAKAAGQISKAAEILERYVAAYPEDHLALKDLAPLYSRLGRHNEALHAYRKIVEPSDTYSSTMQSNPAVLASYGDELLVVHRGAEAGKWFRRAVENGRLQAGAHLPNAVSPGSELVDLQAMAHVSAGLKLLFTASAESKTEAIRHLELACSVAPRFEGASFYLAYALAYPTVGRDREAALIYRRLAKSARDKTIREQSKLEADRFANL